MLLYKSMRFSDVIRENPTLIPILNRFGIVLGVGDKTIEELAAETGTDPEFLLVVLNTYLNDSFFPEKKMQSFNLVQIIDYLTKTNEYYLQFQLPNIQKHLQAFIAMGREGNNSLELLEKLLNTFSEELTAQIKQDNAQDFPYFRSLSEQYPDASGGQLNAVRKLDLQSKSEQLLSEMQDMLIRFLKGDYNQNLCYAVIFSLHSMERDIRQHNRIRHRILYPVVESIKERNRA